MKRFYLNHNDIQVQNHSLLQLVSEHEILELQDLFLTPGFNYLTVPSVQAGRELISSFLHSLQHYSQIACLSAGSAELPRDISSLHDEMAFYGALALSHNALESFLLEQFHYDFLWIESSPELMQTAWYGYFEQKLSDFNIASTMPILVVSYNNDIRN